jgi:hypothetical protein
MEILKADNIPNQLIAAIYNIYKNNLIAIKMESELSEWKHVTGGVRQGCSLSPLLFIIYVNTIMKERRETRRGNIPINRNFNMDTMLFADDQGLIAKSESDLQYSIHNLNKIAAKYSLEINIEKTKVMAFKGREPVRSKICINNKTLEQFNNLQLFGILPLL